MEWRENWHHALAAGAFIRHTLPMQEWIRIGVVALVTAVATSQVSLAELKTEVKALKSEREIIVKNRDSQLADVKLREAERDRKIDILLQKVAAIEARIK